MQGSGSPLWSPLKAPTLREYLPAGILLASLLLAFSFGIAGGPALHGDGREYILQTQSLVFDHTISISTGNLREYWNRTNPFGVALTETKLPAAQLVESNQAGGGFGGLYPDRFGAWRYYHFWAYSLCVAPFYLLAHLLDPSGGLEYHAFKALNVLLLVGFLALLWLERRAATVLPLVALALFTPLIPYCDWQHPELFCLFFVFFAFWAAERDGWVTFLAPLSLGLAAAQNLPIVLFFPFLVVIHLTGLRSRPALRRAHLLVCYAGGGLLAVSSLCYFTYYFGTSSVIAAIGLARLEYASVARVTDLFFSPLVGAAFFYPACVFPLLAVISRRNLRLIGVAVLCILAAGWLATSTRNFNAGQIGSPRYAVWLLAPLWYCTARWLPPILVRGLRSVYLALSLAVCVGCVVYFRTDRLLIKDIAPFSGSWRARPEVARLFRWTHYHDDAETLVENILAAELSRPRNFNGIYLWDLGEQEYLWIFSAKALEKPGRVLWTTGGAGTPRIQASPRQPLRLVVDAGTARLDYGAALGRHRHPVLGEYLLAWSYGRIDGICADGALYIHAATIRAVDLQDCRVRAKVIAR